MYLLLLKLLPQRRLQELLAVLSELGDVLLQSVDLGQRAAE